MAAPAPFYIRAEQRALAKVKARKYRKDVAPPPPDDWQGWLAAVFSSYVRPPFAPYHAEFWEWVWALEAGKSADPFVAIWPRGFGKSQSAETACAMVAARQSRRYVLYVCETQDRADTHVQNIANLLESKGFAAHYREQAERRVGKYGNSQGWRRNRIRTASGFTIDAIGLDTAARGAKVDEDRPDLIVIDDVDDALDSPLTVQKKITTLTQALLPAGAAFATTLVVQNKIHKDGIVARLADGRADFLAERIVSGPHPAVIDPEYVLTNGSWRIVKGVATWQAMPLAALEAIINTIGLKAFRRELQHEVDQIDGALWSLAMIDEYRETEGIPEGVSLARVVVAVDPPITSTGAECGIVVVARGSDKRGYVLADRSKHGTPNVWANAVVAAFDEFHADAVVIEVNQGGEMATNTLQTVRNTLPIKAVHASRGKATRAEPVSAVYEQGRVSHVGTFPMLEEQMTTWVPGTDSPDRMDALVWGCNDLGIILEKKKKTLRGVN